MPSNPVNAINVPSSGVVSFNGTSFSESALTQHDVLVGGASNAISSVGPGTAGQLLLSGGAGANPSYVTPTAGGGMSVTTNASTLLYSLASGGSTLIQSINVLPYPPGLNEIDFTTGITSAFSTYFLLIDNTNIGTAGTIVLQFSSNGGSSYFSTGYNSAAISIKTTGAVTSTTSITNGIVLGYQSSGDAGSMGIYIYNLANGSYPSATAIGIGNIFPTNLLYAWGSYGTQTAMNALRVFHPNPPFSRGIFSLYGIT